MNYTFMLFKSVKVLKATRSSKFNKKMLYVTILYLKRSVQTFILRRYTIIISTLLCYEHDLYRII